MSFCELVEKDIRLGTLHALQRSLLEVRIRKVVPIIPSTCIGDVVASRYTSLVNHYCVEPVHPLAWRDTHTVQTHLERKFHMAVVLDETIREPLDDHC